MAEQGEAGVLIAPSILAADFANLKSEVNRAVTGGADWIHLDVMDGHFVPNLTFGPPVIAALRKHCPLPLDVHLMVDRPAELLEACAEAGADLVTVHVEADRHIQRTVARVRELGMKAGVALNPATPLDCLDHLLSDLDLVLLMTVNPGFGGQSFLPQSWEKLAACRDRLRSAGSRAHLSVDGGVTQERAGRLRAAGATVLVAGSSVFGHPAGVDGGLQAFRRALE